MRDDKTERFEMRISPRQKTAWGRAAAADGVSLAQWLTRLARRAAARHQRKELKAGWECDAEPMHHAPEDRYA